MGFNSDKPTKIKGSVGGKPIEFDVTMPQFDQPPPFEIPKEQTFDSVRVAEMDETVFKIRRILNGLPLSKASRILDQLQLEVVGSQSYYGAGAVYLPKAAKKSRH